MITKQMKNPYVRIVLIILMIVAIVWILDAVNERYVNTQSRILGTWGNDQNLRVTFTDDRGKVMIQEPGKKVKTVYYVMSADDKGAAASSIDKKWTFSLVDSTLKWTDPDGQTSELRKM